MSGPVVVVVSFALAANVVAALALTASWRNLARAKRVLRDAQSLIARIDARLGEYRERGGL